MSDNYYNILGVAKTASKDQIKRAYKKLALKHHPDKNLDDVQGAKKKFTKISQAYAVLSDDNKRAAYDNPAPPPQYNSSSQNQFNSQNYQDNNPQFDQFWGNMSKGKMPNFQTSPFQSFNFNNFSTFKNYHFQFGTFTFQMAEQIFRNAFKEDNNYKSIKNGSKMPQNQLYLQKSYSMPQPQPIYQPKNATLLSQKTIDRNGKQVLVRKYSVNQNGKIQKYTHETIVR